jgi:hypothetical protein
MAIKRKKIKKGTAFVISATSKAEAFKKLKAHLIKQNYKVGKMKDYEYQEQEDDGPIITLPPRRRAVNA